MKTFPYVPPELLQKLNQLYPDRCPDPNDSEREVWMKAGERRVIAKLEHESSLQKNPDQ
jgi:hypothetical protein